MYEINIVIYLRMSELTHMHFNLAVLGRIHKETELELRFKDECLSEDRRAAEGVPGRGVVLLRRDGR